MVALRSETNTNKPITTTVAIVGAGMAGLSSARTLHRRGVDVVVVEGAHRVGGRIEREKTLLGSWVDVGGQWIGHGHHRLEALAEELGATCYKTYTKNSPIIVESASRVSLYAPSMISSALLVIFLEILCWIGSPQLWNTMSTESFLQWIPLTTSRKLMSLLLLLVSCADLKDFSAHAAVSLLRYQGGFIGMLTTSGGAQDALLVEGQGFLIDKMALELGNRVLVEHKVLSITQTNGEVVLETTACSVRAKKVIVTIPPPMLRAVKFEPPLPSVHRALQSATRMGIVYKALAVFERPFWRDSVGGEFLVLDDPSRGFFDSSPPGGPGHLCVLIPGADAHKLDDLDVETRRKMILGPLVKFLGPEVLKPVDWHEKAWHLDEFCGGAYGALPRLGTTEGFLPMLPESIDGIHWAGTETAKEHGGYLEGALESSERVTQEIVAKLMSSGDLD